MRMRDGECQRYCFPGYNTVWSSRHQRFGGTSCLHLQGDKHQFPPKRCKLSTKPQGITLEKTVALTGPICFYGPAVKEQSREFSYKKMEARYRPRALFPSLGNKLDSFQLLRICFTVMILQVERSGKNYICASYPNFTIPYP